MSTFETTVKFPILNEDKVTMETEVYLIKGATFAEAESLAYDAAPDGATVAAMKIVSVENVLNHSEDLEGEMPFFMCENKDKVIVGDKEAKRSIKALVHAKDIEHMKEVFLKFLDLMGADENITNIKKTAVSKILTPHEVKEEEQL